MRTLILAAVLAVSLLVPSSASAQGARIHFDLPAVLPPMVVIEPGVRVVPGIGEEVFFVDGRYWARRDNHWYRSSDHRHGWVLVEPRHVPGHLARMPHGYYRNWDERRGHHDREVRERHEREREHERARAERERHERERAERERHERRDHDR